MANLTDEQQAELDSLTDMLGNLPVGEAIMRCQDAMGLDPRIGADRARMDTAMAAAWAYDRMLTYLDCLRGLNEERMEAGRAIHELKNHPYPTTDAEVEAAALAYTIHVVGGLDVDDQDRYVVIELKKTGAVTHVVPVTNAGLARVEAIVQETAPKVKSLAIDRVRAHFAANPETIPSPRCLPPGLLIGVGGYEL